MDIVEIALQFLDGKSREGAQTHVDNSLCLRFGKIKAGRQRRAGFFCRFRRFDDRYYLVDVAHGNHQTFENMCALAGLTELILGAACYHLMAMVDKSLKDFFEVESLGPSVHQCYVIHAERRLHCRQFVKLVENHIGICIRFQSDDNTHAVAVALVVDI